MDQNQDRRRGHYYRGRRGPDRRGQERRTPPPQEHAGRDQVDVEQIMRDIRARIAQRHGIELSAQQIQELAARRLEAILDPRAVKPALLDQLRRAAGAPAEQAQPPQPLEPPYTFTEGAVYQSHRGIVRLLRRLFKPLLLLFFNPTPVERALAAQSRLNVEAAQRDAERQRLQAEWNALHYEILQRLVVDVSRASLELQSLSARIESLAAKVDFNERRVRHMEGSLHQARPSSRPAETVAPAAVTAASAEAGPSPEPATEGSQASETSRRRRRRRRGRRGGAAPGEAAPLAAGAAATATAAAPQQDSEAEIEAAAEDTVEDAFDEPVTTERETVVEAAPVERGESAEPLEPLEPAEPTGSSEPAIEPDRPAPAASQGTEPTEG